MKLEDFGYNHNFEKLRIEQKLDSFEIGRVIAEHKERYIVKTTKGEFEAEITGNLRFTAKNREDYPAVGDWVALLTYDSDFAVIHQVLPRFSIIKRQAVGHFGEVQIIATNIDYAFLVQAVDRDFNVNRLERYLTICNGSNVEPIIILSKIDLIDEEQLNQVLENIHNRIKQVPIVTVSNETHKGYKELSEYIKKRKTYCLLGSSGVGKSSLLNNISGKTIMRTDTISSANNKGRHVTSHRELVLLESGAILIDNPGMREVGITDTKVGLEITFDKIAELSVHCKFKDCKHLNEIGCAVLEAVESGQIDKASYENYLKMEKEKAYFETTIAEKKKKEKLFGKVVKSYKKDKNRNEY